jgi:putative thioredoxin
VIAFVDGQPVNQFTGALPKPAVESFLRTVVPSEADRLAREAAAAGKDGDRERELELWGEALERDPEYHVARVRRARIFLGDGNVGAAREELDRIPEGSEFETDTQNLRLLADWSQRVAGRGGLAAIREHASTDPDATAERYDLGCALAIEGRFEDALSEFLAVVRQDRAFEDDAGRKAMVALFAFLGDRHALTNEFRGLLARELY